MNLIKLLSAAIEKRETQSLSAATGIPAVDAQFSFNDLKAKYNLVSENDLDDL